MNPVLAGRPEYPRADESYWLYLLRRCRVYAWRRRQELRGFASAADWQRHCASVRDRFRAALGPFPERTPLNPRLVGALERDDYVVEKLLIESQPGFVVTVNLYRPPVVRTPAPAILNPLGHWAQSKAEALVQARGIGLARQGYVALVYDPIGQGERSQFSDAATGAIPIALGTSQHSAACNPCFLIGQTLINYMVWDGVRLLDYLESRPDVDASRIGCTGASGGGTYTMFLTAFDPRIKAAVPVCSTSTYERMLAQGQIGEPCQDPVASYRDDLDVADLLMCAAPTPIQIVAATHDSFPLIGAREAYLDLRDCYTALGVPERAQLVEVPAHHDYSRAMREAAYAWFNRWLSHDGDAIEPPYEPEPAERLWCTATGQVLTSLGGETVLPLNRSRARAIAVPASRLETAAAVAAERDRIREAVAEVLGLATSPPRPSPSEMERGEGPAPLSISDGEGRGVRSPGAEVRRPDHTIEEGLTVEQVVFESEPDLPIPGLVCIPPGPGPHPALLFLDDRGKDVEAGAAGLVPALARAGNLVLAVDLRGWGETAWRRRFPNDPDDVGWLGNDSMLAYAGYLLGGWPVAQRVRDAVRALDVLGDRSDVDPSRLGIVGRGTGGLIALHTAALDRRVTGVAACEALASYRSIVEADRYRCPVSAFIPGVLLRYDLPDLIGALAPLPTLVVNPVDATGAPLVANAAEPVYLRARRTYELLEAGDRLRLRAAASKDQVFEELISWAAF